jgi:hypothetical protein
MIAETLMNELAYQLREAEDAAWQRECDERRQRSGGADYMWLFGRQPKRRELTQSEDFELAQLCSQVRPAQTVDIIQMFRDAMLRSPDVDSIPRVFRTCIVHSLERYREQQHQQQLEAARDSLPQVMKRSIARLHPGARVLPVDLDVSSTATSSSTSSAASIARTTTFVNGAYNSEAVGGGRTRANSYASSTNRNGNSHHDPAV